MATQKPAHKKVIRTTISALPVIWDAAQDVIKAQGFSGPSEYFAHHVRIDKGLVKIEVVKTEATVPKMAA